MFFASLLVVLVGFTPADDCFVSELEDGQYYSHVRQQWQRLEIKDGALVMCPEHTCWRLDLETGRLRATDDKVPAQTPSYEWCAIDKTLQRCDGLESRKPTEAELASVPAGELVVNAAIGPDWGEPKVQVFAVPSGRWLRELTVTAPRGYIAKTSKHCDDVVEIGVVSVMPVGPDSFFAVHSAGLSDCRQGSEAAANASVALHAMRDGALLMSVGSDVDGEFQELPEFVVRKDGMLAVLTNAGVLLGVDPKTGKVVSRLRVRGDGFEFPALLVAPNGRLVVIRELNPKDVMIVSADGRSIARKIRLPHRCARDD